MTQPGAVGGHVARREDFMIKELADVKRRMRRMSSLTGGTGGTGALFAVNNLGDLSDPAASIITLLKSLPDL